MTHFPKPLYRDTLRTRLRSTCPLVFPPSHGLFKGFPQRRRGCTHGREEHGEDVDGRLKEVVAANGDKHRRNEHQVAETQEQCGEELEAVGVGPRVVRASPAVPA